ncbi:MAG: hypothetical protein CM1200mP2_46810 [Planctomycetaceae bacterium]|nr:MAG: hypothetical protein CM1200mP2_46810 [Planctomycetaceae bacterium]
MKLLRVLQEQEFERVGDTKTIRVDCRIVAATNCDLLEEIDEGRFREDLYYRLNVIEIMLPPLRERPADIPLLVDHFLRQFVAGEGQSPAVSTDTLDVLTGYGWPGNVRELENYVERALVLGDGATLEPGIFRRICVGWARPGAPVPGRGTWNGFVANLCPWDCARRGAQRRPGSPANRIIGGTPGDPAGAPLLPGGADEGRSEVGNQSKHAAQEDRRIRPRRGRAVSFPGVGRPPGLGPATCPKKPLKADQSVQRWQSTEGAGRRYDAHDPRTEHNDCSGRPGTMPVERGIAGKVESVTDFSSRPSEKRVTMAGEISGPFGAGLPAGHPVRLTFLRHLARSLSGIDDTSRCLAFEFGSFGMRLRSALALWAFVAPWSWWPPRRWCRRRR